MERVVDKESIKRTMGEVTTFFEKYGLTKLVQAFIDSEDVNLIVTEGYRIFLEDAAEIKEAASDVVRKEAEEMYLFFEGNEVNFREDIHQNIRNYIAKTLSSLPESVLGDMAKYGLLEKAIEDGKEKYLQKTQEFVNELSKYHMETYAKKIVSSYAIKIAIDGFMDFMKFLKDDNESNFDDESFSGDDYDGEEVTS